MSKHRMLTRRTFLGGAGVAMALPLLEKMSRPAQGAAPGDAAAPVRLAWISFPNGTIPDRWQPAQTGPDWEITPSLEPLADHKQDVIVFTGLAQHNARPLGDGLGDHARSAATFLTGVHPAKTGGADIRAGTSIDQVAAGRLGRSTKLASIELGAEGGGSAGSCDAGYSCVYSTNISWRTPTQPMAKEVNPRLAFERLFGRPGGREGFAERAFLHKSILDAVAADAAELTKSLGGTDRRKLDEYFTSVRETEQRIERLRTAPRTAPPKFETPEEPPQDAREHIRLMYDLMALAFQTDTTRIATFMLANELSNKTYPAIGVKDGHHELSHHQNKPEKVEKIARIDRFFVEEFARFLGRLKATEDGESNLLDNSLVLYGCAIGDGNRHTHEDLPILLAGRGGGVEPGRHIKLEQETPLNNLFLSMAAAAGMELKEFGDSTGPLKGLDG